MHKMIPERYGCEVYVSDVGNVCIRQKFDPHLDFETVIMHPDIVPTVLSLLQEALAEAKQNPPPAVEDGEGAVE